MRQSLHASFSLMHSISLLTAEVGKACDVLVPPTSGAWWRGVGAKGAYLDGGPDRAPWADTLQTGIPLTDIPPEICPGEVRHLSPRALPRQSISALEVTAPVLLAGAAASMPSLPVLQNALLDPPPAGG